MDRFYRNFERPPFAPVYHPTEEEFVDPIAYVALIRPEAEQYGVVKIVPPKSFQPPFVIDHDNFEFTPRMQRLNEIEGLKREKFFFEERLSKFWQLSGQPLKEFLIVDSKLFSYFRLYKIVKELGGEAEVTAKKKWTAVAKRMGIKEKHCTTVKAQYLNVLAPFLARVEGIKQAIALRNEDEDENLHIQDAEPCEPTMQGRRRAAKPVARMMAGISPRKKFSPQKRKKDPMASVVCSNCKRGDDEENLMLCESCDNSTHTYCANPVLKTGEWRCSACVDEVIERVGDGFGFYDAQVKYTLRSFTEFANNFKQDYFKKAIEEVTSDEVEKEFWRKVNDDNIDLAVKYGADLFTSKVGSGFPRKIDDIRGADSKIKMLYANHPWNLNNMPVLPDSVLSHIDADISGMIVPWVYVGMCFSTFCWHTEDHWTYSVNYNHWGEKKIWYGISGLEAASFEKAVKDMLPDLFSHQKDLLHHMTTAVNPALLRHKRVNVYTVHQNPGEFVITFPRAYHAGYNEGLNFAEAVNFAPVDWLRMGRLSVAEYALVRRKCVFAHDELVMKMATSPPEKLNMSMCVATYGELLEITKDEEKQRAQLKKAGLKKWRFEETEKLNDDERSCIQCRTTLFISLVTCGHGRNACLNHAYQVCKKCVLKECVLRYRYTIEELHLLVKGLKERTTAYHEWETEVDVVLTKKTKPTLEEAEELLERARRNHFPITNAFHRLSSIVKACDRVRETSMALVRRKVRTRTATRSQRADQRPEVSEIRSNLYLLDSLPCDLTTVKLQLQTLMSKVEEWCKKAKMRATQVQASHGSISAEEEEELRAMADEGDDFNFRLEEVNALREVLRLCEWRRKVMPILAWEGDKWKERLKAWDAGETPRMWDGTAVRELIFEGRSVGALNSDMDRLIDVLKRASDDEQSAANFISSGAKSVDKLLKLADKVRRSEWLEAKALVNIRCSVTNARRVKELSEKKKQHSVHDIYEALDICSKDEVLCNSEMVPLLQARLKAFTTFTQRCATLFLKSSSYYNLFSVMSGRDDMSQLVEGLNPQLTLHEHNENVPKLEWYQMKDFDSLKELSEYLERTSSRQADLFLALRALNTKRPVAETCPCKGADEKDVLACLLCGAKFHVRCLYWDSFMSSLPEGTILCVRCLRSRRPYLADVEVACKEAPPNSFEGFLLSWMVERCKRVNKEALEQLETLQQSSSMNADKLKRLNAACDAVLACEILNPDVMMLVAVTLQMHRPPPAGAVQLRNSLRLQTNSKPPAVLFPDRRSTKRQTSAVGCSQKRRSQPMFHEEDEECEADDCLRPYSEGECTWVACHACESWFHITCVGLSRSAVQRIKTWCCSRCEKKVKMSP